MIQVAGQRRGLCWLVVLATGLPGFDIDLEVASTSVVGATVAMQLVVEPPDAVVSVQWRFGDGSDELDGGVTVEHVYASPGHHLVFVKARDAEGRLATASRVLTVHRPLTVARPRQAAGLALNADGSRLFVANPDQDSVAVIDTASDHRLAETAVGNHPRWLTVAADDRCWVSLRDADRLLVLTSDGAVDATIELPYGSRPQGICTSVDGTEIFVVLQGRRLLRRYDYASLALLDEVAIGADRLALAVDAERLLLTRFRSVGSTATVVERSLADLALQRPFALAIDSGPDAEDSGRGLPNYLLQIAISPDGSEARLPAKKDNIERGELRDGQALDFESTVRAIACRLDLAAGREEQRARVDFNDRDAPSAVAYSPLGDYVAVALQGSNRVMIVDAYDGAIAADVGVGAAPVALAWAADGARLYVHDFLDRQVTVLATASLLANEGSLVTTTTTIATTAVEALPAEVHQGKRIFYHAADLRMSRDGYISCASCHRDGGEDGRVWDFTDRGEGLRNTISLRGRRGTGHGRLHWSANFDEVQDFEHDIRGPFGGEGLMADDDFFTGSRSTTLGDAKAGLSADLDALAAYVSSLSDYPRSPHRAADGSLTAAGERGRQVFAHLNCQACHGGEDYTDSASGRRHDVGSIRLRSGQRLGGLLDGIDTPTLRGLWNTAPYLHDGSAADLATVFSVAPTASVHALPGTVPPEERDDLIAFLLQLDDSDVAIPAGRRRIRVQVVGAEPERIIPRPAHAPVATGQPAFFSALSVSLSYRFAFDPAAIAPSGITSLPRRVSSVAAGRDSAVR